MNRPFLLGRLCWYKRWPIKSIIFGLTVLFVSFPFPIRLVEHLGRLGNPSHLIEPEAPALQPFYEELTTQLDSGASAKDVLRQVERFVYEKVPYEWDWNLWGNADYLPTVTEVIEKGREDCDGRAVVAASLLRKLGYEAELATDFSHMWVTTNQGETMSPGKRKVVVATKDGAKIQPGAAREMVKALGLGIGVFPWDRQIIIVFVLWLLLARRGIGLIRNLVLLLILVNGLMLLKAGGQNYWKPIEWMQVAGVLNMVVTVGLAVIWSFNGRNHQTQNLLSEDTEPAA